jgi:Lon protease-like protein
MIISGAERRLDGDMSEELQNIPDIVPVFPLPSVLFPRIVVPLHVYEPRYVEMTEDALGGEQIIAIALLKDGFAPLYHTRRAPIHRVIGVGRIVASEKADEGTFNLLLLGVARARIQEEFSAKPYRLARVERVESFNSASRDESIRLALDLQAALRDDAALDSDARQRLLELFAANLAFGDLADLIAGSLPATSPELKQRLLDEADVAQRIQILAEHVRTLGAIAQNRRRVDGPGEIGLN